MQSFYLPASGQVFTAEQLQQVTGFSPDEDPSFLASNGIYTVAPTDNPCDGLLYESVASYTVVGDYANQSWSCVALPLAEAKQGAEYELKKQTNEATLQFYSNLGYSAELLVGAAKYGNIPRYNDALYQVFTYAYFLNEKLDLVATATTVDELNNIVNPPTGTINIGRGGGGDDDLLVTTFTSFYSSGGLTESDTELYVPQTSTVISYSGSSFPATPNVFSSPNFTIQIREVATSMVIKEFECPLGLTDVTF